MSQSFIPRRGFLQGGSALLGGGVIAGTSRSTPAAARVGQNRTQIENAKPAGFSAPGGWAIQSGNRSNSISMFAGPESIERGSPLNLYFLCYANSDHATPDITRVDVYRMGYYGGFGARHVGSTKQIPKYRNGFVVPDPGAPIVVAPASSLPFGPDILDYTNWFSIAFGPTSGWETGMYVAVATDRFGLQIYAYFVVRPTAASMSSYDILVTLGFNTYQAYNTAGGNSVYGFNTGNNRACGVSHNRPIDQAMRNAGEYNNMLRSEYAMTQWLEGQGYAVAYMSDTDFEVQGYTTAPANAILASFNARKSPRALLVGGHSEYWSVNGYNAFMAARDTSNTHLMFLSGNSVYWRVHFENRVMYCMKESWRLDTSSRPPTNLWRSYPNNRPENQLLGVMHICDDDVAQGNPSTLDPINASDGAIGWEWDAIVQNSTNPIPATVPYSTGTSGEGVGPNGLFDRYDSAATTCPYTDYDVGQHHLFANQVPVAGDERFLPQGQGPTLVGSKFQVATSGQLINARYWRSPNETGLGYMSLWNADSNELIAAEPSTAYGPNQGWWSAVFGGGITLDAGTNYVIAVIIQTAYYAKSNLLDSSGNTYFPIQNLAPTVSGERPVQLLPGTTGINLGVETDNVINIFEGSQGGSVYDVYYADSQPAPHSVADDRPWYFIDLAVVPNGKVPNNYMGSSTAIGWPSANGRARTFASGSIYWALALSSTQAGDLSDNRAANAPGIQAAVTRQLNTRFHINPGPKS